MESRRIGLSIRTNNYQQNVMVGKKADNAQTSFPKSRPALRDVSNKFGTQLPNNRPLKNVVDIQKPVMKTDLTIDNISKMKITSSKTGSNTNKMKPLELPKPIVKQEASIDKIAYSSKLLYIYDPDENSRKDPGSVTEYVEDIFSYLREMEAKYAIQQDHLQSHKTTCTMRSTLVNWLVELQVSFKLNIETAHMCVSLVDRYLELNKDIGRNTLQLVGVAALMIAAKYEEIYIPDINDFVYVCDDAFSARQILAMERDILASLKFCLGKPSSIHFLRRYSKISKAGPLQHCLAKYMLELALLDYYMCHIPPSHQAAAACCLANAILAEEMDLTKIWSPTLVHYTTYKLSDFRHVIRRFAVLLNKEEKSKYKAVSEKYAESSHHKISTNPKLKGRLVKKLVLEDNNQ